ncbi:hypothetical protein F4677DRAFT_424588 [Hypoxylon crocopeplum]|nr:hypothetical protein F4677DRAFT_424588 [Hypoxylon crocopeplum]
MPITLPIMADHISDVQSSQPAQSGVSTNVNITHVGTRLYRSPLLWLPCELFVHTAAYLSSDDLFSLRLTCRRAETFLFESFSEEFFSDRRFMVTEYSLGSLLSISKHPQLSKRLSKLTIGLDRLYSSDALPSFVRQDWDPDRTHVKKGMEPDKLEEFSVEQNWLLSSGRLQLLLKEVLDNLPNVVELSLRDANTVRETRRPESNRQLVSYGTADVRRQTGVDFLDRETHLHSQDTFAEIVFSAALLAIARSGKRLNVIAADIQTKDIGLSSSAFAIPESFIESLRPTLQNLQSLDLAVSFTYVPLGSFARGSLGFLRWQPHYLFPFLARTPNLVCLRVKTKGDSFLEDGVIGWFAWLAALSNGEQVECSRLHGGPLHNGFGHIPPAPRFRALRELELVNMSAPSASLSKALLYLAGSLRKLSLYAVGISVDQVDDELDSNPRSPNAWTSIFRDMSKFLSLESLEVGSLGHHTSACSTKSNRHQVAFLKSNVGEQSGPRNELLNVWLCAGSSLAMKDFVLEVADKTIIICTSCKQRNPGYRAYEDIVE